MSNILIGKDRGVLRLGKDGKGVKQEEGPSTASFLATSQEKVFALTHENAL